MNKYLVLIIVFTFQVCFSQETDSLKTQVDSPSTSTDFMFYSEYENRIINDKAISKSLQKLVAIESKQYNKLRIVHIGDSHIQADILTNYMRENLQSRFGNAGLGFAFPYKMAKTNGSLLAKLSSGISFENYRNVKPLVDTLPVGLSGIAFYTHRKDFSIELSVQDEYKFNSIRIVTPNNQNSFFVANTFEVKNEIIQTEVTKKITGYTLNKTKETINHTIKKGEDLHVIANIYDVSVSQIKKTNNLKSDNINFIKTLKIPIVVTEKIPVEELDSNDVASIEHEIITKEVTTKKFQPLSQMSFKMSHDYYNPIAMDKIFIIPNANYDEFALNGIVLENNKPGIIYSAIGVNGAKCSDFNKYDSFFDQLQALEPNLIVISFGTNESFDKLENDVFIERLHQLIDNIRLFNNDAEILVTTPQPSQFERKYKNHLVEQYTKSIIDQAEIKNYAVWDMYTDLGGAENVNSNYKNGLITSDKVHYTQKGYKKQADDFFEALMNSYQFYKWKN